MTGWANHSPGDPWGDSNAGRERERTSFDQFVHDLEKDPEEKAALDKARELLRRERGDGEEEAYVS